MSSSKFLDKFSPEIRTIIYGHVFGPSKVITPYRDLLAQDEVHTSIPATNRLVYAEAIEVLYSEKIIRSTIDQLYGLFDDGAFMTLARHVQIDDSLHQYATSSPKFLKALKHLRALPRLRSAVILSDCLSEAGVNDIEDSVSVQEFALKAGLGCPTCVDIGRYQLQDDFGHLQIVHYGLIRLWPRVRATPDDYNGFDDPMAILASLQVSLLVTNVPIWASHTSLGCWVDVQQRLYNMMKSGE